VLRDEIPAWELARCPERDLAALEHRDELLCRITEFGTFSG